MLKLDNYRDIFSSGWNIFWKFFGGIPGMFVHYFQIIPNLLYVCQSVSWLTSLLKLDKSRDISSSGWDIFLKFFEDIPRMLVHYFQTIPNFLYVCQSVSWLIHLLKLDKYRDISISGNDIFWKFLEDNPGLLVHWFRIMPFFLYGYMSVSWLISLQKLGQNMQIVGKLSQFWC